MGIAIRLYRLLKCFKQEELLETEDLSMIKTDTYRPVKLQVWSLAHRKFVDKKEYLFITRNPHHAEFFLLHSSNDPRNKYHRVTTFNLADYMRRWRVYGIKETIELCDILNYDEIKDRISS